MKRIERFVRNLRVSSCAKPFVIWFQERSGSSHLCSILDSHPDIVCRYEDFYEIVVDGTNHDDQSPSPEDRFGRAIKGFSMTRQSSPTPKQVRQHLYDIYSSGKQACGFKFKYPLQFQLFPEVMEELAVLNPKPGVVALFRRNVLKQAISRQNMKRIGRMSNGLRIHFHEDMASEFKKRMVAEPLEIDVQQALDYAIFLKKGQESLRNLVAGFEQQTGISVLSIDYEDILANEKQTVESVICYLGQSAGQPLYSSYEKATPNRLSDGIKNFDELAQAVSGSELEIYLDDNTDQSC